MIPTFHMVIVWLNLMRWSFLNDISLVTIWVNEYLISVNIFYVFLFITKIFNSVVLSRDKTNSCELVTFTKNNTFPLFSFLWMIYKLLCSCFMTPKTNAYYLHEMLHTDVHFQCYITHLKAGRTFKTYKF